MTRIHVGLLFICLLVACLQQLAYSFAPYLSSSRIRLISNVHSPTFQIKYQQGVNGEVLSPSVLPSTVPILPSDDSNTFAKTSVSTLLNNPPKISPLIPKQSQEDDGQKQNVLVLPKFLATDKNNGANSQSAPQYSNIFDRLTTKLRKLRPATQFRTGVAIVAVASLSSISVVKRGRWMTVFVNWITHRGFQGLAALGRTVTYGWAAFVAYPRLLDRRAKDRQQRTVEKKLERRRVELNRLNSEVSRLRKELSIIDAEIRSFRREIISFKVMGTRTTKDENDMMASSDDENTIQEAIKAEMTHLANLRAETQEALSIAKHNVAEAQQRGRDHDDLIL